MIESNLRKTSIYAPNVPNTLTGNVNKPTAERQHYRLDR